MQLYHFLSSEHAINNITLQRIKVSTINNVNDPFEFEAYSSEDGNIRGQQSYDKMRLSNKIGFISFCRSWASPVVWAHYAQHHKGICLGFNIPDQLVNRITYALKRPNLLDDSNRTPEQIERDMAYTKARDWRYEKEWRHCINLEECELDNSLYFLPFSANLKLNKVILGSRCEYKKHAITELVSNYSSQIKIIKAGQSESHFEIIENIYYKEI